MYKRRKTLFNKYKKKYYDTLKQFKNLKKSMNTEASFK